MNSKNALRWIVLSLLTTSVFAQNTTADGGLDASPVPSDVPRLTLLKQFQFQRTLEPDADASSIAFDRGRVYVTSPDGLVLAARALDSDSELHPIFRPDVSWLSQIYVYSHVLYVLAIRSDNDPDSHTLFQSTDRGRSFQAIDEGLRECTNGICYYLNPSVLFVQDNLLFVNAGGGDNLLLSDNDGKTFQLLSGELPERACYNGTFDINPSNRTVMLGGECSIDFPYLKRGVLTDDLTSFENPPQDVEAPYLQNRKVNAIKHKPGTPVVFAANEGGVLRSIDDGQTFHYVLEYPIDSSVYPYTSTILIPSKRPEVALVGGWDKGTGPTHGHPYLAYGTKNGSSWKDISYLFRNVEKGIITQLTEDEQGRIIVVLVDLGNKTVSILQMQLPR
jgi:hypothetical protein